MFFVDPDATGDIANLAIVAFAILAVIGLWYKWYLTGAGGFIWQACAVTYLLVIRILLVAQIEPFVRYSAPFALPFYILLVIGVWLSVFKLRSVYIHKQDKENDKNAE